MSKAKVENSIDFLTQPHYTMPARPDFLSESFQLHLSEQSKRLYALGKPGQGYVGLVDLANGEVYLVPSFNANDGLLRVDRNDQPFDCFVESQARLGQLSGDLHLQGVSKLNLSREMENPQQDSGTTSKKFKKILGFGIWKEGAPVRFLPRVPGQLGLVPNEYIFVKNNGTYELSYIDRNRQAHKIPLDEVPNLSQFLSSCSSNDLPSNEIDPQDRKRIELIVEGYHAGDDATLRAQQATASNIKFAKNRSTSQNASAIEHSLEYRTWFLAVNQGHSSHLNDLERELPYPVFAKIMDSVTSGLEIDPIDIFESNVVPSDNDSIRDHLEMEVIWEIAKPIVLLQYGFFKSNDVLIQKALDLGANFAESVQTIATFAIENHRTKSSMKMFVSHATTYDITFIDLENLITALETLRETVEQNDENVLPTQRLLPKFLAVQKYVDAAIDELQQHKNKNMAVDYGIRHGNTEEILELLSNGANPNFTMTENSLFLSAIIKNLHEVVDKMLNMELTPNTLQQAIVYLSDNIDKDPRYQKLLITILERSQQIRFIDPENLKSEDVELITPSPRRAPETKQPEQGDVASSTKSSVKTHPILLTKQSFVSLTQALLKIGQVDLAIQLFSSVPEEMQEDFYNHPVDEASNFTINTYFQDRIAAIEQEKSQPVHFHLAPPSKPEYELEKECFLSLINATTEPTKKIKLKQFLLCTDNPETTDPSIIAEALYEYRHFMQASPSGNNLEAYQDKLVTRLFGDPHVFLDSGFADANSLQKETFLLRNIALGNASIVAETLARDDFEPSDTLMEKALKIAGDYNLGDIEKLLQENMTKKSSSLAS